MHDFKEIKKINNEDHKRFYLYEMIEDVYDVFNLYKYRRVSVYPNGYENLYKERFDSFLAFMSGAIKSQVFDFDRNILFDYLLASNIFFEIHDRIFEDSRNVNKFSKLLLDDYEIDYLLDVGNVMLLRDKMIKNPKNLELNLTDKTNEDLMRYLKFMTTFKGKYKTLI